MVSCQPVCISFVCLSICTHKYTFIYYIYIVDLATVSVSALNYPVVKGYG